MITEPFDGLLESIKSQHSCDAVHVECADISVALDDGTAWRGTVHTFSLVGHPTAAKCFAWYGTGPRVQRTIFNRAATTREMWDALVALRENAVRSHAAVLASPQVLSAEDAVRTYYSATEGGK